jgi:hypothetical protein
LNSDLATQKVGTTEGSNGSVRDAKPCQRWRQLSPKAAMATRQRVFVEAAGRRALI